ncbi:MAG: hypothetical protein M3N25_00500 [Actinomycetota bacterium]|nr:hypothetical protein [Actinomycetota bacterium]
MIVRILTEGQYDVPDDQLAELNDIDERVSAAVQTGDEEAFAAAMDQLLGAVVAAGSPVPLDSLLPSDLVLPAPDSTLDEVRNLLADDGLIPG